MSSIEYLAIDDAISQEISLDDLPGKNIQNKNQGYGALILSSSDIGERRVTHFRVYGLGNSNHQHYDRSSTSKTIFGLVEDIGINYEVAKNARSN